MGNQSSFFVYTALIRQQLLANSLAAMQAAQQDEQSLPAMSPLWDEEQVLRLSQLHGVDRVVCLGEAPSWQLPPAGICSLTCF